MEFSFYLRGDADEAAQLALLEGEPVGGCGLLGEQLDDGRLRHVGRQIEVAEQRLPLVAERLERAPFAGDDLVRLDRAVARGLARLDQREALRRQRPRHLVAA